MRKDYSNVAKMHTPISKSDISGSPSGPVTTYFMSPDEINQRYGHLDKPQKTDAHVTTGRQFKARGIR